MTLRDQGLLLHNLRTIGTHHCDGTVGEEEAQEIERLRGENAVLLGLLGDAAGVIRSIDPEDGAINPVYKSIESVERVSLLDPLDVGLRIEAFFDLRDGWLDGKGLAPPPQGLHWLQHAFSADYSGELRLPYLYPTPEGGVRAEWSTPEWEVSLDIDLNTRAAEYQALNLRTDVAEDARLNLGAEDGWRELDRRLRASSVRGAKV